MCTLRELILGVKKFAFLFCLLLTGAEALAQTKDFFSEGLALEKEFKVEAALEKFELAIRQNPRNAEALTHASRMLSNIGGRLPKTDRTQKMEFYERAKTYAEKSIAINPANPETRLAYVISLGLQSEIATSPHEKVRYAQDIHNEATKIIQIDSTFAEAYFILGKWQFELSRLNWVELMACRLFFGGFPEEISMERALEYFKQANNYKQDFILFLYGLASAQHALGENDKAVQTLQRALALPMSEPDDALRKERCQALLKQIIPKQNKPLMVFNMVLTSLTL
jgi:tetratricopeptide (TPR) repeat protein